MPLIHHHTAEELHLAFVYRIYFRFQTYSRIALPCLNTLTKANLDVELRSYGIHLLDLASDGTDIACQVSLRPEDAVAACAGKLKGRLSKLLRVALQAEDTTKLLAKGYFACTIGDNSRETVLEYLDKQGTHHGYMERPLPPVLVADFPLAEGGEARLDAAHNVSLLRFHIVLGTQRRRGIFTQSEAERIIAAWRELEASRRFGLVKVSFVPDHVHLALRTHPSVAPRDLLLELMNAAEETMNREFAEVMIRFSAGRLWESGAYVGSFGDITSTAVRQAMRRWQGGGGVGGCGLPL